MNKNGNNLQEKTTRDCSNPLGCRRVDNIYIRHFFLVAKNSGGVKSLLSALKLLFQNVDLSSSVRFPAVLICVS